MVIFDTDIFIWFFRGDPEARELFNKQKNIAISVISYMEIIQGARDKRHLAQLQRFLKYELSCIILPVNELIGKRAAMFVDDFVLSHRLFLADALIAATAVELGLPIFTSNEKHFRIIPDLDLQVFHPTRRD